MLKRDLPPLLALRAFEAATRRASFKAAAAELFVTPTAISHHVRRLEEFLGVRVLERTPRAVRPTAAGTVLFDATVAGFEAIHRAVSAIRGSPAAGVLTISSTTAFLGSWLVPKLPDIQRVLPELQLRLHASDDTVTLQAGAVDLAIRYGSGPYPGVAATMLKKDLFAPVCSPRLGVVALDDLHSATLLHIDGRQVPRPAPDWERWSAAFGPARLAVARGPRFTDGSHALQAAIAGQGIAIVSLVLVESALKSGLLVRPFDGTLEGECYHFVATRELGERADVVSLREWFRSALN